MTFQPHGSPSRPPPDSRKLEETHMNDFQPRFDRGIYRDCKWCLGRGCLSCPAEADKEYKRQFPDGPKPILTIKNKEFDQFAISEATGGPSIEDAHGPMGRLVAEIFEATRKP